MRKLDRPTPPDWYAEFRQAGYAELVELAESAGERSLQGYIDDIQFYRDRRARRIILGLLLDASDNLCYACESPMGAVAEPIVEHYRPKLFASNNRKERTHPRHYWWLVYDWENFQALCPICNRYKASLFPIEGKRADIGTVGLTLRDERPLLLNPLDEEDPVDHFEWNASGMIEPLSKRGATTIEVYALNRPRLVRNRRLIFDQIPAMLQASDHAQQMSTQEQKAAFIDTFLIGWTSGFSGVVRQILETNLKVAGTRRMSTGQHASQVVPSIATSSFETLWIEKLRLENFCLFADTELTFPDLVGSYEPWLGIVGENGVGKSSFLKAIALALASPAEANVLVPDARELFNRNTSRRRGLVEVTLNDGQRRRMIFSRHKPELQFEGPDIQFPVIALGASRIAASVGARHGLPTSTAIDNLFDPILPLVDPEDWLADTDQVSAQDFSTFGESLTFLLGLNVESEIFRRRGKIYFHRGNNQVRLAQMSDGFRSVIGLVTHIMRYLAVDTPVMSKAEGTVLLDEIELHLHPKWKIQIVSKLRQLFPLVRFVITTHDPLCLRGLEMNETSHFALNAAGTNVEITPLTIRPGMDVNDLLVGGWFQLPTTLDRDTQAKIHDYSALLLQADRQRLLGQAEGGLESAEQRKIEELRDELRTRLGGFVDAQQQRLDIVEVARKAVAERDDEPVSTVDLRSQIARAFESQGSG